MGVVSMVHTFPACQFLRFNRFKSPIVALVTSKTTQVTGSFISAPIYSARAIQGTEEVVKVATLEINGLLPLRNISTVCDSIVSKLLKDVPFMIRFLIYDISVKKIFLYSVRHCIAHSWNVCAKIVRVFFLELLLSFPFKCRTFPWIGNGKACENFLSTQALSKYVQLLFISIQFQV